jgi:hypothetical protein
MYAIEKRSFQAQIKQILDGEEKMAGKLVKLKRTAGNSSSLLCATCGPTAKSKKARAKTG